MRWPTNFHEVIFQLARKDFLYAPNEGFCLFVGMAIIGPNLFTIYLTVQQ